MFGGRIFQKTVLLFLSTLFFIPTRRTSYRGFSKENMIP